MKSIFRNCFMRKIEENSKGEVVAVPVSDQEISMPVQGRTVQDEFQLEINRMRNSLNALTLKNFMFDGTARHSGEDEDVVVEEKELVKPPIEAQFKRSLSKHRQDSNRTRSKKIDPNDILAALTASQEKVNEEKPKVVHFAEEPKAKSRLFFHEPSRDSDEVAKINNELPWQKKHEYRTVTPFLKPPNKSKTRSSENIPVNVAFRPIETSRSTEDVNIVKPVPIFASKSHQELSTRSREFKPLHEYQTRSSDDLLLDNIDGLRKPESKRHMLMRIRSTSNNSLNRLSDQLVYQNFQYDIPEAPTSTDNVRRKKAPQPLPRIVDENSVSKRDSKTIVYVLDKKRDEFILETDDDKDDKDYDEVLLHNNVDQYSDLTLFDSLLDSREDCKFISGLKAAGESHFHVQCLVTIGADAGSSRFVYNVYHMTVTLMNLFTCLRCKLLFN